MAGLAAAGEVTYSTTVTIKADNLTDYAGKALNVLAKPSTLIEVEETVSVTQIDGSGLNGISNVGINVADGKIFTVTGNAKTQYQNGSNGAYNAAITLGDNSQFNVGGTLYLGWRRNAGDNGITHNSSISFGDGASMTLGTLHSVTAATGANVTNTNKSTLSITASFDSATLSNLGDKSLVGTSYSRNLITTTGGFLGFDVTTYELSSISGLDALGYTMKKGLITSMDDLANGQYGLILTDNKVLSLVAKGIPEPTTATLSLLALAGLCARRRRY